jgi:polyferredoxin
MLRKDTLMNAPLRLILIILLVVLVLGLLPVWPYSSGWGWYPSGGLGLLLVVLLVLAVIAGTGDRRLLK